jgi:pimeloyl-ACP methyl ester carboxylesterase
LENAVKITVACDSVAAHAKRSCELDATRRGVSHRMDEARALLCKRVMSKTGTKSVSIVLVHGAFVDGSGWQSVYERLNDDGYEVGVVQNPTASLSNDVAATRLVIAMQRHPVILVGHSYGGAVTTEAGMDPKVIGLVYVAAFAPDKGESVASLLKDAPAPPILPPRDGFLVIDSAKFHEAFAGDLEPEVAGFMAASQTPWGVAASEGRVTDPAWRHKPSHYLVATADKMIPPALQRTMAKRMNATVTEAAGSHAIYVSQPRVVTNVIEAAAEAIRAKAA